MLPAVLSRLPPTASFVQHAVVQLPVYRVLSSSAFTATQQSSFIGRRFLSYDPALRPIATQMASSAEIQLNPPRIKISRLMEMEDTQMFGLVHGCTQLQLVEDAGTTLTTQFCNQFASKDEEKVHTLSACLERADFLKPMLVGDIAEVEAEITYTTPRSLQVTSSVYAKNSDDGSRYKTVEAKTWFVPKTMDDNPRTTSVPPLLNADGSVIRRPDSENGYRAIKQHRDRIRPELFDRPYRPIATNFYAPPEGIEPHTVDFSRCSFLLPIHPNHCVPDEKYCRGGVILRLMDECCAVVVVRHNNNYSFTANMDSILFHRKVNVGTMISAYAKAIFASNKTIEVAVRVEETRLYPGEGLHTSRVADGILTFMSVDPTTQKTRPMPPLKLVNDEERQIFAERKELYEQRKRARDSASAA